MTRVSARSMGNAAACMTFSIRRAGGRRGFLERAEALREAGACGRPLRYDCAVARHPSRRPEAREVRVRFVSRTILALGLAAAAGIYAANAGAPDYRLDVTKQYLRTMETYGGKANVIATEFRLWFDGLWHGRTLAFTVAVMTIAVSLVYRFLATPLPPAVDGDGGNGAGHPG